jgi:hypothetical protein
MDIKTETLGTITQAAYDKSVRYLKSVGKRLALEFRNSIVYGVGAVFKTGDATHINKVLPLLVIANLEPAFKRVVVKHDIVPFKYNTKTCQYTGKIDGGRRAALQIVDDAGVPQWETLLNAALNGEEAEKTPAAFVLATRLSGLVKKDRQQETPHSDAEIRKLINEALKEFPMVAKESTMVTAEDQQRIEDNKTHLAGRVAKAKANGTSQATAH